MTEEALMWRAMAYGILMWAVTIYAFRRGGWEERLASVISVVGSYLTPLLTTAVDRYLHVEWGVFFIDLTDAALLSVIMTQSKKFWPIWVAAISYIQLMGHLLPLMPPAISPLVYYSSIALWSYPAWVIIAIGVRRHSLGRLPH